MCRTTHPRTSSTSASLPNSWRARRYCRSGYTGQRSRINGSWCPRSLDICLEIREMLLRFSFCRTSLQRIVVVAVRQNGNPTIKARVTRAVFRHLSGHFWYRPLRHSQSWESISQVWIILTHDWLCGSGRYRQCPIKRRKTVCVTLAWHAAAPSWSSPFYFQTFSGL